MAKLTCRSSANFVSAEQKSCTVPFSLVAGLEVPEKLVVGGWSGVVAGWDIHREPGSQVPTKSSDSHKIFAAFHAVLAQI